MRILLVSDLHLDTAFGWAGPALGDVLRANLRATLDRIATLARHSRVDALVCGGDLFDQARATPDTLAHLRTTFAELDSPCTWPPGTTTGAARRARTARSTGRPTCTSSPTPSSPR